MSSSAEYIFLKCQRMKLGLLDDSDGETDQGRKGPLPVTGLPK